MATNAITEWDEDAITKPLPADWQPEWPEREPMAEPRIRGNRRPTQKIEVVR